MPRKLVGILNPILLGSYTAHLSACWLLPPPGAMAKLWSIAWCRVKLRCVFAVALLALIADCSTSGL